MPTTGDCEKCTQECPQRQAAKEQAEKRMYATNEFVAVQKDIDSGKLASVVEAYWMWNIMSGNIFCSRCHSLAGTAHSIESFDSLRDEQHYCYNCGSKMIRMNEAKKNPDSHARWIRAECSEKDGNANCSRCGQWDWDDSKYCKGCGSKMTRSTVDD